MWILVWHFGVQVICFKTFFLLSVFYEVVAVFLCMIGLVFFSLVLFLMIFA